MNNSEALARLLAAGAAGVMDVTVTPTGDGDDLDDWDDPMTVCLSGPCSICGQPVDPAMGICPNGHDDLDRSAGPEAVADAGRL